MFKKICYASWQLGLICLAFTLAYLFVYEVVDNKLNRQSIRGQLLSCSNNPGTVLGEYVIACDERFGQEGGFSAVWKDRKGVHLSWVKKSQPNPFWPTGERRIVFDKILALSPQEVLAGATVMVTER